MSSDLTGDMGDARTKGASPRQADAEQARVNRQNAETTLQMQHTAPAQRPPSAQSSLPVLPLVFATIGVVMAIIAIVLTLR